MTDKTYTLADLEAVRKQGRGEGYDLGLRDGRMSPQELAAKHLRMKTWIPKRRSDKPAQEPTV